MAKEAIPSLEKALDDEEAGVRVWAACALARIEGDAPKRVEFIMDLWMEKILKRPFGKSEANSEIAEALKLLGQDARPARDMLLKGLQSERVRVGVQGRIVEALTQLTDDADVIVPKLLEMLELKEGERSSIYEHGYLVKSLGQFGPRAAAAVPRLRKLQVEADHELATLIDEAIARIGKEAKSR